MAVGKNKRLSKGKKSKGGKKNQLIHIPVKIGMMLKLHQFSKTKMLVKPLLIVLKELNSLLKVLKDVFLKLHLLILMVMKKPIEKSNFVLMIFKVKTVLPISMEWISLLIKFVLLLENGKL